MGQPALIIDGNARFRCEIKSYLHDRGLCHDVREAGSARAGITKAAGMGGVIVLMDVDLPDINGIEAAGLIHERNPHSKIVLFSYFTEQIMRRCAATEHVRAFIHKYDIFESLEAVLLNSCDAGPC